MPSLVKSVESDPGMNFAFWPVFGSEGEHIFFFFSLFIPPIPMQILSLTEGEGLAILLYKFNTVIKCVDIAVWKE